jgi:hypothetical protein
MFGLTDMPMMHGGLVVQIGQERFMEAAQVRNLKADILVTGLGYSTINRHQCDAIIARRLAHFMRDGWVGLGLFNQSDSEVLSSIFLFEVRFPRLLVALGS